MAGIHGNRYLGSMDKRLPTGCIARTMLKDVHGVLYGAEMVRVSCNGTIHIPHSIVIPLKLKKIRRNCYLLELYHGNT
jgi:hypothetical protein